MDAKLVNPFVSAVESVLPQMGFQPPTRSSLNVRQKNVEGLGVSVIVGFTKQLRGNVVYNMSEDTAKFIASTMMMGMPVAEFDAMAQSAISEMSNMLTATAATNLTALSLEVDISTPSLSIGSGFHMKISDGPYLTVAMDVAGHLLEVDIAVEQQ
ncbi:chemotaxis protein CheX [Selenomonas sp.]|uniref:chemotaxis protein CheX n=1 Tax=Selenomonas sp. TaxID=2053611 RepID=UPI0025EA7D95|nr:chemotaxis protein CheX [Selenomonas sp.]MCI6085504.1 chemotaxis protein CheX [Selenomonas sp.]MCI6284154.1 chemotaxis protein CheX [Selenomonas sp.]MDY3296617.1 chemotaxis protein CheX [Selenomonas sp.]MDY4416565.1 chemotaxis protein CheX [Selenomonas sp.]